ncbi:Mitochondrial matrix Mmp37 domain-containing protein [Paramicrosporidium saccamoebae]|uniref:Phosphatidate cytidylyltransferase, mitochondrial n=1 Tax=Paramicrosporidium saccamoebae TaxID=1246581 RepID=A0A2H9TGQ2_9FUNG|nr:Mitochondrial matrix Mmp37 domain-containing protein [Paramicrosporidium saccamoebae]
MLDFIFVVADPLAWHYENRQRHPTHYHHPSSLDGFLQYSAAGLYYVPSVVVGGQRIKYGVIATASFQADMRHWTTLYVAGRLHKSVRIFHGTTDLLAENRMHAMRASLLSLGGRFSLRDFLQCVVRISYCGDPRMGWAEDPHKVGRILDGQYDELAEIYSKLLTLDAETVQSGDYYNQVDAWWD